MAVIPNGVEDLYATIVSYLITVLTIMFFVKLIMIFTSIGGLTGGGGGGDTPGGRKKKDEEESKKPRRLSAKELFDEASKPEKLAEVLVNVRNADDKNVKGAYVELWPNRTKNALPFARWKRGGEHGRYTNNQTNADGVSPQNAQPFVVPSVPYKFKASYQLQPGQEYLHESNRRRWFNTLLRKDKTKDELQHYVDPQSLKTMKIRKQGKWLTTEFERDLRPGDNGILVIPLSFKSEYNIAYEPVILDVHLDESTSHPKIHTTGVIKP